MAKPRTQPSAKQLEDLMAQKSGTLLKAQSLAAMGVPGAAEPLWASAAALEERIAALLDAHGEGREAAVHRISAASCYRHAGDPSCATNLYRAALAGPLREGTRVEVERLLAECLALLAGNSI